ncbi:uncharacterized protein LOC111631119 isoform X2 [Centruroides sculpturatus]|uniref:uncharacterized protein LOC111631119 isoform X2 n=1 Tax=Centruroides sculpturatus TaxID=218467 RepID=UPI000C6D25C4|nr:uncharacterized protein LOC111631119 isoform X2 [Centruroides sculpturatus]
MGPDIRTDHPPKISWGFFDPVGYDPWSPSERLKCICFKFHKMNNDEISQNKETDTSLQFLPSTSIEPSINEKNENETSKDITYNESFETACSKSFSEFGTES